ncbi:hypothetical protein [Kitasatospora sp. NPDC002965]|uniref:hypothetical protein n=1 Tax=Kitasatospora sp. NPDC002965 TaxID=3154775 RepID=UPI0033A3DD26
MNDTIAKDRVHFPACGSADTVRRDKPNGHRTHDCARRERSFEPRRCPRCGGARIDGSTGISGQPYETLPDTAGCWDCGAELPNLRDPFDA